MEKQKSQNKNILSLCAFVPLCLCAFSSPAQARRVVSLMPSYTEIIFALGAGSELVGVTNFCDRPPEAAKIEKVGDYLRPNAEKIYSLKPDVVFTGRWKGSGLAAKLSALGLKMVEIPPEAKVADIARSARIIAAALGRKKEGEKLASRFLAGPKKASADKTRTFSEGAKARGKPVSVYLEADEGLWTVGGLSFLSDAVERAGGKNIFSAEKKDYFQTSWEEIVTRDPDAIVLLSSSKEEFLKRPMAAGLKAARGGRIITSLDRNAFTRPAPGILGEIEKLKTLLRLKDLRHDN
ncbi:MAG: helical backbone metal receptor [Elusimicrobia bacterium]|nr:helical backbone metal receptor [Elusimicrobiota bacterium]